MKKYIQFGAVLLMFSLFTLNLFAQTESINLEIGKTIEREIAVPEKHLYKINVPNNNYLVVKVDQKVDVIVTVMDSNGKKILEVDNPFGIQLAETIRLIPNADTEYLFEVKILEAKSKPGSYKITLETLRLATSEDQKRMTAENLFADADIAANKRTAESYKTAEEKFKESLPIFRELGDKKREHYVVDRLARIAGNIGDKKKSQEYAFQAFEIAKQMNDKIFLARSIDYLGVTFFTQGESRKAIQYWEEVLQMYLERKDQSQITATLNNIGAAYGNLGEYAKSMEYYKQVLEPARKQETRNLEIGVLRNIGVTYANLGEREKGLEYLEEALAVARKAKERRQEAAILTSMGSNYSTLNNDQKAIEILNQSIIIEREMGNKFGEISVLNFLGYSHYKLKEYQKALEYLNQGIEINKSLNLRNLEATLQYQTGLVYAALKEYEKARDYFTKAQKSFEFMESRLQKHRANYMLAQIDEDEGKYDDAQAKMKTVLEYFESARKQFVLPEQRSTYFSTGQAVYESYIDLLMKKYRSGDKNALAEAFQISEKTRARSLLEIISGAKIDIRQNASPELIERENTLRELINDRSSRLTRLLTGKFTEEQKLAAEKELADFRTEYQDIEIKLLAENKRYAGLISPSPLSLAEIQQQVLDSDTILLEYALGKEKSYLFVVTQNSIQTFELPKRAEIETQARAFFDAMTSRNKKIKFETAEEKQIRIAKADGEIANLAENLSQTILAPAQNLLTKKRLLIVADGILQYIPFASLTTKNKKPLVSNHEIVSLPSASTLAVIRKEFGKRKPAPKILAVVADPVFNSSDERFKNLEATKKRNAPNQIAVSAKTRGADEEELNQAVDGFSDGEAGFNFSRLPFTRKEAETISATVPTASKKLHLDFSANLATAVNPELANYQIVHFATHSFLNSRRPELSGIVLSLIDEDGKPQNGFLRTDDIYNLNFPAELIVLSGCRTGFGKEIRGEGLVGLTRGFMYAGAKRVAVSLWDVNDEATAELMSRFYKEMLGNKKLSPAAALQQAQISMSKDKRWNNPYYWAGFILQGEVK